VPPSVPRPATSTGEEATVDPLMKEEVEFLSEDESSRLVPAPESTEPRGEVEEGSVQVSSCVDSRAGK